MINIFDLLVNKPLGFIIEQIYKLGLNYGWSIIIFTIIVKLIILPLNIKSQKAMRKQQKVQPILMELQKKYANDREKLSTETMKVYKENNISMMGGCLPLLIQFPILIGLWNVIRKGMAGATDLDFYGLDLAKNPSEGFSALMRSDFSDMSVILLALIPILAAFTTWFSAWQTQRMNKQPQSEQSAQMNKSMNIMMPLMTGFFSLSLPGGLGIYWIVANLFQIAQQYFVNLYLESKEDDFIVKVPESLGKKSKKRR